MRTVNSNAPRVLMADDQEDVLSALRLLLKGEGYRLETVNSPKKVLQALEESELDAALIDQSRRPWPALKATHGRRRRRWA